eukprot:m.115005 g.115005  ORF g.115005 m.115005 type:complete len:1154 (+) comp9286_c1_seq2:328-3789(+)
MTEPEEEGQEVMALMPVTARLARQRVGDDVDVAMVLAESDHGVSGSEEVEMPELPSSSLILTDDPTFYQQLDNTQGDLEQVAGHIDALQKKLVSLQEMFASYQKASHSFILELEKASPRFELTSAPQFHAPLLSCATWLTEFDRVRQDAIPKLHEKLFVEFERASNTINAFFDCKAQMVDSHHRYTAQMAKFCSTGPHDDGAHTEDFIRRSNKAYAARKTAHLKALSCVEVLHDAISTTKARVMTSLLDCVHVQEDIFLKGHAIVQEHSSPISICTAVLHDATLRAEDNHRLEVQNLEDIREAVNARFDAEVATIPSTFERKQGIGATLKRAVRKQPDNAAGRSTRWRKSHKKSTSHALLLAQLNSVIDDTGVELIRDKQGYAYRIRDKKWKLEYLAIRHNTLCQVGDDGQEQDLAPLTLATVRLVEGNVYGRHHVLKVITPMGDVIVQPLGTREYNEWRVALNQGIADALETGNADNRDGFVDKDPSEELLSVPGNDRCCDCNAPDCEWASINLGIVLCIECSGIHRSLGVHISKVRSISLDRWQDEVLAFMKFMGNTTFNMRYEAKLLESGDSKPTPSSPKLERSTFIQRKYVEKMYEDPAVTVVHNSSLLQSDLEDSNVSTIDLEINYPNNESSPSIATQETPYHGKHSPISFTNSGQEINFNPLFNSTHGIHNTSHNNNSSIESNSNSPSRASALQYVPSPGRLSFDYGMSRERHAATRRKRRVPQKTSESNGEEMKMTVPAHLLDQETSTNIANHSQEEDTDEESVKERVSFDFTDVSNEEEETKGSTRPRTPRMLKQFNIKSRTNNNRQPKRHHSTNSFSISDDEYFEEEERATYNSIMNSIESLTLSFEGNLREVVLLSPPLTRASRSESQASSSPQAQRRELAKMLHEPYYIEKGNNEKGKESQLNEFAQSSKSKNRRKPPPVAPRAQTTPFENDPTIAATTSIPTKPVSNSYCNTSDVDHPRVGMLQKSTSTCSSRTASSSSSSCNKNKDLVEESKESTIVESREISETVAQPRLPQQLPQQRNLQDHSSPPSRSLFQEIVNRSSTSSSSVFMSPTGDAVRDPPPISSPNLLRQLHTKQFKSANDVQGVMNSSNTNNNSLAINQIGDASVHSNASSGNNVVAPKPRRRSNQSPMKFSTDVSTAL